MKYTKTANDKQWGIAYEYDPTCYFEYIYYQSQDMRNEVFHKALLTGEIRNEDSGAIHRPTRICTVDMGSHLHTLIKK